MNFTHVIESSKNKNFNKNNDRDFAKQIRDNKVNQKNQIFYFDSHFDVIYIEMFRRINRNKKKT